MMTDFQDFRATPRFFPDIAYSKFPADSLHAGKIPRKTEAQDAACRDARPIVAESHLKTRTPDGK